MRLRDLLALACIGLCLPAAAGAIYRAAGSVACPDPGYDGVLCALANVPTDACTVALPRAVVVKPSGLLARARDATTSRKQARLLGRSIKALRRAEQVVAQARIVARLGAGCAQAVGAAVTDARTRAELLQAAS